MTLALAAIAAIGGLQARAATLIQDDFSTFADGDLVGQNGWAQFGGSSTGPLQVSGGNVLVSYDQNPSDNQDAIKSFATQASPITSTVYQGMSLRIDQAPTSGVSYLTALLESSGSFSNARLAAIDNPSDPGNSFLLEARYTGQGGNPYVPGEALVYGETYNVVLEAVITGDGSGEEINVFVNPTSNDINDQTPYLTAVASTGQIIPPVGMYAIIISQYALGSNHNAGAAIDHINIATTFGEAAAVPEPSSFALAGLACLALGFFIKRRGLKLPLGGR